MNVDSDELKVAFEIGPIELTADFSVFPPDYHLWVFEKLFEFEALMIF